MFHHTIPSLEALDEAARKLLEAYPDKRVFAFYGEMGAGKTTLIKALCKILGVTDVTSSPTFGLIHDYLSGDGDSIFHFDFYRIEKIEEVYDIGYEEYMYSGDYCFLEWPEKIESILPDDTIRMTLTSDKNGIRELRGPGS